MREAGLTHARGRGRQPDRPPRRRRATLDARLAPGHRARRRPLRRPARRAGGDRGRRAAARELPFAVEVVGFADEEGVRFGTAYLGSARGRRAASTPTGRRCATPTASRSPTCCRRRPRDRGPRQTCAPTPRSTSSRGRCSSAAASRSASSPRSTARATPSVTFVGEAGHAGTVPHRRAAATRWPPPPSGCSPSRRAGRPDRATVGRIRVEPGGAQRDPRRGAVTTLDVRHADDGVRRAAPSPTCDGAPRRSPTRRGVAARVDRRAATSPAVADGPSASARRRARPRRARCPAAPATTPR